MSTAIENRGASKIKEIKSCTDLTELSKLLMDAYWTTIEGLMCAGQAIVQMERLGFDETSDGVLLRSLPGYHQLKMIAENQLEPRLLLLAFNCDDVVDRAMRLPMDEQKKIANNEPIPVAVRGGDFRPVTPTEMSTREVKQVFGPRGIRTLSEQVGYMIDEEERKRVPEKRDDTFIIDKKHGQLIVNFPTVFNRKQLVDIALLLAGI